MLISCIELRVFIIYSYICWQINFNFYFQCALLMFYVKKTKNCQPKQKVNFYSKFVSNHQNCQNFRQKVFKIRTFRFNAFHCQIPTFSRRANAVLLWRNIKMWMMSHKVTWLWNVVFWSVVLACFCCKLKIWNAFICLCYYLLF